MARDERANRAMTVGAIGAAGADATGGVAPPGGPGLAVYDPEGRSGAPPQPVPTRVGIRAIKDEDGRAIAVVLDRDWPPGTTGPRGGCRLCGRCVARNDRCVVIVTGPDAARLDAIDPKIDNEIGLYAARLPAAPA